MKPAPGDGESVDAETYVRRCPVTRHILEAREPFFWIKTMAKEGELYNIVRHPRGPGIHGLQIPVFGPLGLEGAMSLGGRRIDASRQTRLALALIATTAFFSARRLLEAAVEAVGPLSDREREVLAWTAAGRRQIEIAATLGLSERTVENHLRRICKLPGASQRRRRRSGLRSATAISRADVRNRRSVMGKTVLITGAASGFGRGVAFGLAKRGHKVIAGCQIWPQVWVLRNAAR